MLLWEVDESELSKKDDEPALLPVDSELELAEEDEEPALL
jgi:hypothetical protein